MRRITGLGVCLVLSVLSLLSACGDDSTGSDASVDARADLMGSDASSDVSVEGGCVEGMTETRATAACGEESRTCSMGAWSDWTQTTPDQADPECRIGEAMFANRDGCEDERVRWFRCGSDCRFETEPTECGEGCDGVRRTEPWFEEEICVPAGRFTRGCDDEAQDCFPRHDVYLSAFYIDRHTVTVERYQQCVDDGGCTPLEPFRVDVIDHTFDDLDFVETDIAVWGATHEQAEAFCQWDDAELVTGAQWERAATGVHEQVIWPMTDDLTVTHADWCDTELTDPPGPGNWAPGCGGSGIPPRRGLPNDWEVARSSIGVANYYRYFEWTRDSLAAYAPQDPPEQDPVIRGGEGFEQRGSPMSFFSTAFRLTVSARNETAQLWGDSMHASIRCARPARGSR